MHTPKMARSPLTLAVVATALGCAGESPAPERAVGAAETRGALNAQTACSLVRNRGQEGYNEEFTYNAQGLVHSYFDQFGGLTTFAYDAQRRLKSAVFFDGFGTFNTDFVYANGRIARELVSDAATGQSIDVIVNSYNVQGQLVRRESHAFDFFATFLYDANGNAYQVDVRGVDGFLFIATTYAFTKNVRNPHLALHGLPYSVPYINEVTNPWRQTAAKSVVTGSNGDLITLYDQDPNKSILLAGPQNYATFQSFFDKLSSTFFSQKWEYSGCGSTASDAAASAVSAAPRFAALRSNPRSLDLKQQIAALRAAHGR